MKYFFSITLVHHGLNDDKNSSICLHSIRPSILWPDQQTGYEMFKSVLHGCNRIGYSMDL